MVQRLYWSDGATNRFFTWYGMTKELKTNKALNTKQYSELLADFKNRIKSAQYTALRSANRELVQLYWDLGRLIAERQEKEKWGKSVIKKLARDLQITFPGVRGFSDQNLWRMRRFYAKYARNEKLSPRVIEISWSNNIVILDSCSDDLEREFYLRMTKKHGWSKNMLIHQIESQTFKNTLNSQTNFDKALPASISNSAKLSFKDEYIFDFLALGEQHDESELEGAILKKVEQFLREMGGTFAFMGRQYRLQVDDKEYFIDLLLYHRKLKCLVALELKVGEFIPKYVGKMQFYLTALDDLVREENENPSIGIIICKSKSRTIVEYTLREAKRPIGVSTYKVVSSLPTDLIGLLPNPEQIERLLRALESSNGEMR